MAGIKVTYRGTHQFEAKRLNEVLRNKRLQIANPVEGIGTSQSSDPDSIRRVNLENAEWYVYNDNYGTSEEKSFVKYFSTVVDDLKQRYDEVYLVRNERLAPLAIYSFETGERFDPTSSSSCAGRASPTSSNRSTWSRRVRTCLKLTNGRKNSCSPSSRTLSRTPSTSTILTTESSACRSTTRRTAWPNSGMRSQPQQVPGQIGAL